MILPSGNTTWCPTCHGTGFEPTACWHGEEPCAGCVHRSGHCHSPEECCHEEQYALGKEKTDDPCLFEPVDDAVLRSRVAAAEADVKTLKEALEYTKHKECELCPFLGRGDPLVDETAARLVQAVDEINQCRDELGLDRGEIAVGGTPTSPTHIKVLKSKLAAAMEIMEKMARLLETAGHTRQHAPEWYADRDAVLDRWKALPK
jgi:hypothetical protein